ncbi:MAG: DUF167 domain-containing protein [Promethearchaeota archaeon]
MFIEKKDTRSYLLHIHAKPNSQKQGFLDGGNYLIANLQSKPIQNKANKELISILKKKLKNSNNDIQIISGAKISNKLVSITFYREINEEEIIQKLLT